MAAKGVFGTPSAADWENRRGSQSPACLAFRRYTCASHRPHPARGRPIIGIAPGSGPGYAASENVSLADFSGPIPLCPFSVPLLNIPLLPDVS